MPCVEAEASFGKMFIPPSPPESNNCSNKLHRLRILPHMFVGCLQDLGDPVFSVRHLSKAAACLENIEGVRGRSSKRQVMT